MPELMPSLASVTPESPSLAESNVDRERAPEEQKQLFDSTFNYFQFFLAQQEGIMDDAAFDDWVGKKSRALRVWCDTTGRAEILKYVENHTREEIESAVGMDVLADAYRRSIH